jgi:hypothetical protein
MTRAHREAHTVHRRDSTEPLDPAAVTGAVGQMQANTKPTEMT